MAARDEQPAHWAHYTWVDNLREIVIIIIVIAVIAAAAISEGGSSRGTDDEHCGPRAVYC